MQGRAWRKILYEKQAYPDNYVDVSFLELLLLNAKPVSYSYWEAVSGSLLVTQRLLLVALFVCAFLLTLDERMSVNVLIVVNAGLLIAGYAVFLGLGPSPPRTGAGGEESGEGDEPQRAQEGWGVRDALRNNARTLAIVYITLLIVSPVLKTLTDSFSNDTIWALSSLFMVLHLLSADYAGSGGDLPSVQHAPFSFNAAIFASVLLVSRLASAIQVFALITFAIELFALAPLLIHRLHTRARPTSLALMLVQATAVIALFVLAYSVFLGVAFGALLLFVTFIAPGGLLLIRRYKNTINGPWDEARPSATSKHA